MAKASDQAAWRTLPIHIQTTAIAATSTVVPTALLVYKVVAFVAEVDMKILRTRTSGAPTALSTSFPILAGIPIEFKVLEGDQLTAIGEGDLVQFETG